MGVLENNIEKLERKQETIQEEIERKKKLKWDIENSMPKAKRKSLQVIYLRDEQIQDEQIANVG